MPTISVIVPAYNAERTILQTIQSIQQQSFSDLEIIVINDGSTDRTLDLLNTVKDDRLKIFSYENGGVSVARNRGLSHATGKYMAFIDADDLWTSDKLEAQLAALEKHPEAGVAYSWTSVMDENGKIFYSGTPIYYEGDVYASLLLCNFIANGSNILVRREAIEYAGEFDATLCPAEDWDYCLQLARRWHFVVVPKAQVLYRKSCSAASAKIDVMEKSSLTVIKKAFQEAPLHLQYLKSQSQSILYEYLAELSFMYVPAEEKAKLTAQKLQKAIRLHPKILIKKKNLTLIIKLAIIQFFSPKVGIYILQIVSKIYAAKFRL